MELIVGPLIVGLLLAREESQTRERLFPPSCA